MFPKVFGCLEHTNNCFFFPYRGQNDRNETKLTCTRGFRPGVLAKRRFLRLNGHQKGGLLKKQTWEGGVLGLFVPSWGLTCLERPSWTPPSSPPSPPKTARRVSVNISASVEDVVVKPQVCCIRSFDKNFHFQKWEQGTGNGEWGLIYCHSLYWEANLY